MADGGFPRYRRLLFRIPSVSLPSVKVSAPTDETSFQDCTPYVQRNLDAGNARTNFRILLVNGIGV